MRLIHTSDWHLGMQVGLDSEAENQRFFFEQLYDIIREERIDAVLCAGDVYDSGVANAEAIGIYNDATTMICHTLEKPMVVIAGNHDSAARLSTCRDLLSSAGLHVTGRLVRDIAPVLLDGGKVAVYPIPFFNRDEVIALFPECASEVRTQEQAMNVVCDNIRSAMDPSVRNIALAHAYIVHAELSESDRAARVGFATAVSRDVFAGFDYVALGHIHKPQAVSERIRYAGSPIKYSFGSEEEQQKSVVILDTDTMEQRLYPLKMKHDRKTVKGTYYEILAKEDIRDAFLRLVVTDRYAGLELVSELKQRFPYLVEVVGKSISEGETLSALSVEELQHLDETDIMKRFLAENFSYVPTEEQCTLFADVLKWSREEVDEA